MFLDNKYSRWYFRLMETRKSLRRDDYLEKHHIIPRALGGSNARFNLVNLTAREHFIAHMLLPKMLQQPQKRKMQFAFMFMMGRGRGKGRQLYIPSSRIFEIYRKECVAANTGRKWSDEQREKMRKRKIVTGRKPSLETRIKMSEAQKRRQPPSEQTKAKIAKAHKGKKLSPEHIEKLRAANIGKKQPPRSTQWLEKQRVAHIGRKDPNNPKRVAAHSGANNPRAKTWTLEREDGSVFEIKGLKPWCKERGLSFDAICRRDGRWFGGVRLLMLP